MKKGHLIILLGIIVFHILMLFIGNTLKMGLMRFDSEIYKKFDLMFKDKSKFDIVFIGSSRTYYGINPSIIEKLSGKNAINIGLEGAKLNEMEIALKGYLYSHPKPGKIILMIDPHSFSFNENQIYNKIYLSNYLNNDSIYSALKNSINYKPIVWKYIPYFILTEFDDYTRLKSIKGIINGKNKNSLLNYNGFCELKNKFTATDDNFNTLKMNIDNGVKHLFNIISICNRDNIDIQIVQGPFLKLFYEKNKMDIFYKNINELIYNRFPNTKIQTTALNYTNLNYFKDETHVNNVGAIHYSTDIFTTFIKDK
ncbi:MAG: hypothetical protein SFY56_05910 [Bacteroidota bacterium]|nr:hypothetical protein [Bacteroidota bacterium]